MTIGSVNYSSPVTVNGYSCRNCTDVDLAKKGVDPQHPKSGPDNRDAASDPTRLGTDPVKVDAIKRAADHAAQQVVGYSPFGALHGSVTPGSAFSIIA